MKIQRKRALLGKMELIKTNQIRTQDNIKTLLNVYAVDYESIQPTLPNISSKNIKFKDVSYFTHSKTKDAFGFGVIIPNKYRYTLLSQQRFLRKPDANGNKSFDLCEEVVSLLIKLGIIPERYNTIIGHIPFTKKIYRLCYQRPSHRHSGQPNSGNWHIEDRYKKPNLEYYKTLSVTNVSMTIVRYELKILQIPAPVIQIIKGRYEEIVEKTTDYGLYDFMPDSFMNKVKHVLEFLEELSQYSEGIDFDMYIENWVDKLLGNTVVESKGEK